MSSKLFHGIRAKSAIDAFCTAAANGRMKEMKLLLADGVDVNGFSAAARGTALHSAVRLGLARSVEFLLAAGADPNRTNAENMTALMCACSLGKTKGSRIAIRLLHAGADARYVRKSDEMTALKFAAESCSAEVIQSLIKRGAEVEGPNGTAQTALMHAARAGNIRALVMLLGNGADVFRPCTLKWAQGRTAEGLAELEGHRSAAQYLRQFTQKWYGVATTSSKRA